MARSVFYYHLKHLKTIDKYFNEKESIKLIFHEHKGRYGYRRVTAEMHNRGFMLNHKTIQRLMDDLGLKSKIRITIPLIQRWGWHDSPEHNRQGFYGRSSQPQMGDRCNTDKNRFCQTLSFPDMFNGEIISYNISRKPDMEQIYDMLDKAFTRFDSLNGLILHSDQGWQY